MRKRVLSFDYDGCLANKKYRESGLRCIIHHNQDLFSNIIATSPEFDKTTIFVGSNRQSYPNDQYASDVTKAGLFLPQVKFIEKYLIENNVQNVVFDSFLLADIYGNLDSGESYRRFEQDYYQCKDNIEHSHYLFDEQKITLLYAQLHKYAAEHHEDNICFDFFDDRKDILEALWTFYDRYSEFIPKNITLRLHHYQGIKFNKGHDIVGTGKIDKDFRKTVKIMGVISTMHEPLKNRFNLYIKGTSKYFTKGLKIFPLSFITPEKLESFSKENYLKDNKSSLELIEVISEVDLLKDIDEEIDDDFKLPQLESVTISMLVGLGNGILAYIFIKNHLEVHEEENSSTNSFKARPL